jgi:type III pantothenate kinase
MLYIDIGNSLIKVAEFAEGEWSMKLRVPHDKIEDALFWMDMLSKTGEQFRMCSVVSKVAEQISNKIGGSVNWIKKDQLHTSMLDYKTPDTLGVDRVLACYGAWKISNDKSVIVVDAGTATTIDFMDRDGVFRGGVIAPGIGAMEHGLRNHAPALPQVDRVRPAVWPPKSTTEALQWGITGSFQNMVRDHVQRFLTDDPDAEIWISGGDAAILMNLGDKRTHYHPNLVFEGLRLLP